MNPLTNVSPDEGMTQVDWPGLALSLHRRLPGLYRRNSIMRIDLLETDPFLWFLDRGVIVDDMFLSIIVSLWSTQV